MDCGPMNITSFLFRWSLQWISCSLLKVVFTTYLLMFHYVQFAFFTFSSASSNDLIFLGEIFMKIFFWRLRSLLGILFLGGDVCQQITQIWASLPCRQSLWLSKCSLPQLLSHKLIWSSRYISFSDTLQVSYRGSRWKAWFLCSSIVRRRFFFLNHIDSYVFPNVSFLEQSICFQLGTHFENWVGKSKMLHDLMIQTNPNFLDTKETKGLIICTSIYFL